MSTFGEIGEPSSRAIWEDWDDIESELQLPQIKWREPLEVPEEVDSFCFLEGKFLWDLVLKGPIKTVKEINSIEKLNVRLYKAPNTTDYFCAIKESNLMMSNDVVKLLQGIISKSKTVTIVVIKSISEYHTAQTLPEPYIIRKIITSDKLQSKDFTHENLEQPNIISGVPAGVFTLREHLQLPAAMLVIYMPFAAEYQMKYIEILSQTLNFSNLKSSSTLENMYI